MWALEKALNAEGFDAVAGVDEAGRGPLAGPVVAAAVVLPNGIEANGVQDSKQVPPRRRERLFAWIQSHAVSVGVGIIDVDQIERVNILQAARRAMAQAVARLDPPPQFLLIDGKFGIDWDLPQRAVVKGDSRSISIAAASIVAKVTRDRMMLQFHDAFPQYGFDRHKGYPTRAHRAAIAQHGPCRIHRRTFKGVREFLPASMPDRITAHDR
ncbi:MAG: ribonuclease HII [Desulfatitalea sp.]|nr:ribonuclease HII [Desulfatitalea sp.]NNJ99549.1 ribonuclease HII [Desulfatitalea sp.]